MLRKPWRYIVFPLAIVLALPLIATLLEPSGLSLSEEELRSLTPPPAMPASFAGWLALPSRIDSYLRDNFGLRQAMVRGQALVQQVLLRQGSDLVFLGLDGWLFYRGDQMVLQSAGLVRHDRAIAETADFFQSIGRALAARGAKFLIASPPNSATIYGDKLPKWARNTGRLTDYDLMMQDARERGVFAVDLRPALRRARTAGQAYYKHDTHWTPFGANYALNALALASGHPDWQRDPARTLAPPTTKVGGDLARMLGIDQEVTEEDQPLQLPPWSAKVLTPQRSYVAEGFASSGPVLMILGDSFTSLTFAPMLLAHVRELVWIHHEGCGFDWKWVEEFHPEEVWYMPTERQIMCNGALRPKHFNPQPIAAAR